jgi:cell division transport system ATP-binding protein
MEKEALKENEAIITISDSSIYQENHLVLDGVNISVQKGEFIFLIGKNGSGKSSFLKTLYAELKLENGEGSVSGISLNKIKKRKIPYLRRKIGIIFQDFQLLTDRSISENLHFVLKATGWKDKKARKQRVEEVLSHVGLTDKLNKFPHELSGGEQQKVAIARSLLNEPEILLADEPTGNLDPNTSEEIMKILHSLSQKGKAILMASHDYDLMKKYASRILRFEEGVVKEEANKA